MNDNRPENAAANRRQLLSASFVDKIAAVAPASWDACAGGGDPFITHAYLQALEESGVVSPATGWAPRHLLLRDEMGRLTATAPLYLKTHSDGEYWSDHAWADGYTQAGGRYYPKLLLGVPFAPVSGRRLLIRPDAPQDAPQAMIGALAHAAEQSQLSSIHAIFPNEEDAARFDAGGWLSRQDIQFEWRNENYHSFNDFLAALTSRKRKQIRRYRKIVIDSGIKFELLSGDRISPAHWMAFLDLLNNLHYRRRTKQLLNLDFFLRLGEVMPQRLLMSLAIDNGVIVAAALIMLGDDRMYLRYWGCADQRRFLHFEMGCHQPIEYAITHGYAVAEGGYGGSHKLARGMTPTLTYSAHWFQHPRMRAAVADYLAQERDEIARRLAALRLGSPYKRI